MRALIQRVSEASVRVDGEVVASIGEGLLVFLGVGRGDSDADADRLAGKVARARVFDGDRGRMDRSLADLGPRGGALCVSQFTLYGDSKKGNRPSFGAAADPGPAEELYEAFCEGLVGLGIRVERGVFGARMSVELRNEGPVTLMIEV